MNWTSSRKVILWWTFLSISVILGYTYRHPIKIRLFYLKTTQATKGYKGPLQDSHTKHIQSAICLNTSSKTKLPKETLGEIQKETSLRAVKSTNLISVGFMDYSTAKLQLESKDVLEAIAVSFREKLNRNSLPKVKIILTSAIRSRVSQRSLLEKFPTSPVESPHLYGYTFNISYQNYQKLNIFRRSIDGDIFKKLLEETLFEFRKKDQILVTGHPTESFFTVTLKCSS